MKKFILLSFYSTLFGLALLLCSPSAYSYAIVDGIFDDYWYPSYLLENILSTKTIRYALDIEDPQKFPDWSIKDQVETSLRIWMRPFHDYALPLPQIIRVKPDDPHLDLLVKLTSGPPPANTSAETQVGTTGDNFFSTMRVNTAYTYKMNGKTYDMKDFHSLLPGPGLFVEKMATLAKQKNLSIADFAKAHGFDDQVIWASTYPTILHEMGHTFGLADTVSPQMESESKPTEHSAGPQPESIMKWASFLTLSPDDQRAIKFLLQRTYKNIPSPTLRSACATALEKIS